MWGVVLNFAEGFERISNLRLPGKKETVRDVINRDFNDFLKNKERVKEGKVPMQPVRMGISFICSRSGRWAYLDTKVREQLKERNPMDLLRDDELESFLDDVYARCDTRVYKDAKKKISQFLGAVKNLNDKLKRLPENERLKIFEEEFEKILKTKANIGRKGCDNILRDCGFFDHIPVDIHERRFLLRTGIFHKYASPKASDPTDYDDLAKAMVSFCKEELKEVKINGRPLSNFPGMVDLIIWYFSQKRTEQPSLGICSKDPQCEECPLKDVCFFAIQQYKHT